MVDDRAKSSESGYWGRLGKRWAWWVGLAMLPVSVMLLALPNLIGSGVPGWVLFFLAGTLIFVAQYQEWKRVKKDRDQWEAWYRQSFVEDEIAEIYGPDALMRRIDRVRGLDERWTREADRIRAGDFSNAAMIPALAREYLRVPRYVLKSDHGLRERKEQEILAIREVARLQLLGIGVDTDIMPPAAPQRSKSGS